ncbi:MAG: MFS transporter [Clostridia bacterium]|nr:MFS transporter [Clostridia bacterium]
MKLSYKSTISAGFVGYATQALTINFPPLLYVAFGKQFNISTSAIATLIAVCFLVQLLVDLLAAKFSDRMNVRVFIISAHVLTALGMVGLGFFPNIMPPIAGLMLATVLSSIGSGLVEVLITPIVESCPTPPKKKSSYMSLLHSFYCWGQATVILLSTVYFYVFGREHWQILSAIWAIIPISGAILFSLVPLYPLPKDEPDKKGKSYLHNRLFWIIGVMMLVSGAAEMTMAQWASAFAEAGLKVSPEIGNLLGPFIFALLMGSARVFYAKFSAKISLKKFILFSSILCIASYLTAAFSPFPIISLLACGICGLSVGVLWPGNISIAAGTVKGGGVSMFALLALLGDLGCMTGPSLAGTIAGLFNENIRISFAFSSLFPIILLISIIYLIYYTKKVNKNGN